MKNKYATIAIILTTIILAGVAIFTAFKLYQSRNTAIAPNVPSSKPNAQVAPTAPSNTCQLQFSVTLPTCAKLYFCKLNGTSYATESQYDLTTFRSCDTNASLCDTNLELYMPGQTSKKCYKTMAEAQADPLCKQATATATATSRATATSTSNATATSTSRATATSTSNATATATSRATATATATANPQCNNSCTNNSGCPSGLMCYITNGATSGNCRNTQCLSESDCTCPVITTAPTATAEPTLPVVGTRWPTILGTGFGILVILGSLLLAL